MPLSTNKDIWTEILKYFHVSLSCDNADDIKEKRRIILSIALVCPELVDIALDELWRSLTTLEPIISVFNAPLSENLLEYTGQYGGCWIVLPGKITIGLKSRVTSYLSRIKYLHFPRNLSSREYPLWNTLLSTGFTGPLCPNLREMSIAGMDMPSQAYNLTALASPSLQSIKLQADDPSGTVASSIILDTLNYHGMRMLDIKYTGYATHNVLLRIFQFSELRSLTIRAKQYQGSLLKSADVQSFGTLAHLTTLDISLDMFQTDPHVGRWIESMEQLSILSLQGKWSAVCACMQGRTFPAVQSLSLILQRSDNRRSAHAASSPLSTIFKAFPSLHSLCLDHEATQVLNDPIISPADIAALKEKPLRRLEFRYIPLPLSDEDIVNIMQAWPMLERLSIIPSPHRPSSYDARKLLPYASQCAPCLHDMAIPLDFSSLTPPYSVSSSSKCPLQRLELSRVQNLPRDLKGMHTLARNLVSLFPRLHTVTSNNSEVGDLQMIVKFLQDVISSPPSRPDSLF
ncbi:hypothetical protein AGABI1DRAFT_125819 [Agaricus bisporus var. burnettii JB137-S8]|uniref:F-box domain-containing protein n=1 Tax=Agaricus bisporus var. burnettii (strain JB137-S8 / ATCC MYA-4627 / FGSC 10392) TaxID=597362 RepID=K5XE17_AGABU|nr:uncharacterized protein AGABI1DRAFT_125819 [Agaricus bisporus var. burnettii JB137-S8]EKM81432.1 hypothetical protein AGABI1DRAFT_125819 [Agaricus bisporus var. burnettii JB137-S8]